MNIGIRNKTENLRREWSRLKNAMLDENISFKKHMELKNKEDEVYRKYLFYKNLLNASRQKNGNQK